MNARLYLIALCLLCGLAFPHTSSSVEQDPRQFVNNFYTWYFDITIKNTNAVENDEIFNFVEKKTVEFVRSKYYELKSNQVDYFYKEGFSSLGGKGSKAFAHDAIQMIDNVYVIPVTFTMENTKKYYKNYVVVYVKRKNGVFFVFKVADIFPYS